MRKSAHTCQLWLLATLAATTLALATPTPASADSHIWTVPGATTSDLAHATAVTWDPVNPSILVADGQRHQVVRIGIDGSKTVLAGTGQGGFNGDQADARQAQLQAPLALAVARNGDIIVADAHNHRIRRITPGGGIVTIAGIGERPFNGDQKDATQAQLSSPSGVAVTRNDKIYIADHGNHRVRKITPRGELVTIAGTGIAGSLGDGASAKNAQLNLPLAVAVAPNGDVVVADSGNQRVRRINHAGVIRSIAINLGHPCDVAVDGNGRVVIADNGRGLVWEISADGKALLDLTGQGAKRPENGVKAKEAYTPGLVALAATPGNSILVALNDNNHSTAPRIAFIGPKSDKQLVAEIEAAVHRGSISSRKKATAVLRSLRYWSTFPQANSQLRTFDTPNSRLRVLPTAVINAIDGFREDRNHRAVLALRARMADNALKAERAKVCFLRRLFEFLHIDLPCWR